MQANLPEKEGESEQESQREVVWDTDEQELDDWGGQNTEQTPKKKSIQL